MALTNIRKALIAALAILLVTAAHAFAATSDWARNDHAEVRLIAGSAAATGALDLGLEFRLKPGWHIYWRAPGDAGLPPTIDWAGSINLQSPAMAWPMPERYSIFGLTTFVYGGRVVLPIDARAADPSAPVRLRARVNYLACEKICVPYEATFALDLAPGLSAPVETAAIGAFRARVPQRKAANDARAPLLVTRADFVSDRSGLWLDVLAKSATPLGRPEIMVEGPPALRFGAPRIDIAADRRSVLYRLPAAVIGQGGAVPADPRLTITLADLGTNASLLAVEQTVTADSRAAAEAGTGLGWILLLALLGGLVLNLMPCVLPVLSLKLLSVVGHGGERKAVRRGFLATAAGIVFSFLVLAAGALGLKAAGLAVGWGIQFQSPVFLGFMAVLLTLFALSLFGVIHIPLPGIAGTLAARAPQDVTAEGKTSLVGAFATGAFATLLATPCSAPFLGTALGFALTRGAQEIVSVFAVLGLGLAAPYLAVAAFPALAARLPRPGAWMKRLRIGLGVALLATVAWLGSVMWTVSGAGAPTRMEANWRPFDKVQLYNLVAEGRVVLVDVTADWCVTCKANKALVLERGPVAAELASGRIVAMRADWTRPDPRITGYLRSFGRFGIPFNAVYGPARPDGLALPEILTESAVLAAFRAAGQGK
jgi:suppressor for copper-sensitivity B